MKQLQQKALSHSLRKARVRSIISGTKERPRLSVTISNKQVSAQIIDDQTGRTLVSASSARKKPEVGTMTQKAEAVGADLAKKAKTAKIKQVVFDRNGRKYHGRVKTLAETARTEGLEF